MAILGNATSAIDGNGNYAAFKDVNGNATSFDLSSNTNVLRATAGAAAIGQTIKTFTSSGGISINATTTTGTIYTVTALKTFFMTDVLITCDSAVAILVQVKAGATVILESYISTTAPLDMTGIESQDAVAPGVAISIAYPTTAGKNISYKIAGFEQ